MQFACTFQENTYSVIGSMIENIAYTSSSSTVKVDVLADQAAVINRKTTTGFYFNRVSGQTHCYIALGY